MNPIDLPQQRVENIRMKLARMFAYEEFVVDKSGCKMVEIVGAHFLADQETIFGKVDQDYIVREINWYNSTNLNISGLGDNPPKEWIKSADSQGFVNSNYGWAIYTTQNYSQFGHVLTELSKHRDSRRAVMIYTRPSMWYDYKKDGMNDFMCTNDVQYLIRDNQIIAIVNMRSNDAVYGYKNDLAWQQKVLGELCAILNTYPSVDPVTEGPIIWNAGSLHVYERHFPMLQCFIDTGKFTPSKEDLEKYK